MGTCGLDCCHSWPSLYLKQGSITVSIKKMQKEHCFCNEYICLLKYFGHWFKCVILISFCTCETDYLLSVLIINFRKQETNIPLTCIFIYTVQTKLVQCTPPLPPSKLHWWEKMTKEKKKCNLFRACLYFEEDILNQIVKEAGQFFYVRSDRLMRKYCIMKKAKGKVATEPTLFMRFWCLL